MLSADVYKEAEDVIIDYSGQIINNQIWGQLSHLECEIVGMHKFLEDGKSLTFIPLLENL
jgi:hypothetical protein